MSKERKDTVMSFRVPSAAKGWLDKDLGGNPIVNVPSANRFCRKIVLDFISGKLVYVNQADRALDPDVASSGA